MTPRLYLAMLLAAFILLLVFYIPAKLDNSSLTHVQRNDQTPRIAIQREDEQLRVAVETYLADDSKEYDFVLAEAVHLLEQMQFADAANLLESARARFPDQPDLLAQHAEAIALANNGSYEGEPFNLLNQALEINNRHKPSLWMMALVNQEAGNHEAAVMLFKLLQREILSDGGESEIVDAAMAMSVERLEVTETLDAARDTEVPSDSVIEPVSDNVSLKLFISLNPEITQTFAPDDSVYVYATESDGSSAPLAVTRHRVSEFPMMVTLDDSMSMVPTAKLSSSEMVTVGARASHSGTAMPQSGDWEVELFQVPVSTQDIIPLTIDYELR